MNPISVSTNHHIIILIKMGFLFGLKWNYIILVVSTPLKNMSLSVGMMTFPTKIHGSKPPTSNSHGVLILIQITLPYGKRLHSYGKSPFSMGKSTIFMVMFNSNLLNYQRVYIYKPSFNHHLTIINHRFTIDDC